MLDSAIGFGGADWLICSFGALLVLSVFLWTPRLQGAVSGFASRTKLVMLTLFAAPIVLRLFLLGDHPVPVPQIYDEWSHLLVADTLLHFRLANPPHPFARFFETFFVLQQPTYSSIYPLGQGLLLAFGRLLSGIPWTGVLFTTGAFCSLTYWMLRGYLTVGWALLGGLLAAIEFGPLNLWMNSYWGGALPAAAGCLVFGALPRLQSARRSAASPRAMDAVALGLGLGIHLLTRPFESLLLFASVALFPLFLFGEGRPFWPFDRRTLAITFLTFLPAIGLTLLHDKRVTGSWTTLPEALSQREYGVPTTLSIQRPAVAHRHLTPEQSLEYRAQLLMHGPGTDSLGRFLLRLEYRARYYRFFFWPPLYLAALAFLLKLRERIYLWVAATVALFALGTNLFPYLLVHYLAAVTCLFLLISVAGLERIARFRVGTSPVGLDIVRVLILLCGAQFVLWYSVHLFERHGVPLGLLEYETWDGINHPSADRRAGITKKIAAIPGSLLIFVHYTQRHIFQQEWVWNAADIDTARVVFARDRGDEENEKLIHYYGQRSVFWLEPDGQPPTLLPWSQRVR